jgi:uncharacterized integral membrane protein
MLLLLLLLLLMMMITTTMIEDVRAPFCCSEFPWVHEIIYSAVIGHLGLPCQKIFLPYNRSIME